MPQIYIDKIKHDTDVFRLRDTTLFSSNSTNLKIHQSFLPSYVDDVLEYSSLSNFPSTGEAGKIYVDTTNNKTYRWSGSTYIAISSDVILGTTHDTAYYGDYGAAAYAHGVTNKGNAFSSGLYKITTNSEGHVTAAAAVQKSDITGLGIPASDTDTKNTAGSTNSTNKLFLIGATSQAANPQTYSRNTVYIGTDGKVYSANKAVLVGGSNSSSAVTINTDSSNIYSMSSAGSVVAGTAPSFTQGVDSFTAAKLNTGFYTAGTATTPAVINTSKFSGGSFTRGSFSGGSFTQGTDSFTTNVPTKIDTSKFNGGSFTRGTFSQGTLPSLTVAVDSTDSKQLNITFSQGTLPTHAADSFTAASLASGFYTAGAAASFTQGTDSFTAATHGNDSFTAASLASGFYTAGTKGTPTTIDTSKFSGGSFTQGTDTFSAGTTPPVVTLPTRSSAISVLTDITSATAAAQTFTGITE